jgi:hypothetical protein
MRKGKGRRPLAQRCERLGQEMAVERRQGFASPGSRPLARHGSDSPAAILYEYRLTSRSHSLPAVGPSHLDAPEWLSIKVPNPCSSGDIALSTAGANGGPLPLAKADGGSVSNEIGAGYSS